MHVHSVSSLAQVLFSAHGVPKSYIDAGDPYKNQIESCVKLISAKVDAINAEGGPEAKPGSLGAATGGVTYHLSYQSRVGPVEWLQPYTDGKIHELAEKGCKNLVVVPVSFVSEHIETLEEIDMEYREVAEEAGITNWRRCVFFVDHGCRAGSMGLKIGVEERARAFCFVCRAAAGVVGAASRWFLPCMVRALLQVWLA